VTARVLHVLQPEDGGVRQHVLHVAGELRRRGWAIEVAGSESAGPGSEYRAALEAAGVVVHTVPMTRSAGMADVRAGAALRQLDRERGYDIVHAHSSKAGALVRGALPRRRRLAYTPHCPAFVAALGPGRAVYWAAEQALVPLAGAIVACSEWERRILARRLVGAKRRLRLIRNGVPPCREAEVDRRVAALRSRGPVTGFLARMDPQKDPLALVEAVAIVKARGALRGPVAMVGSGSLDREVQQAIERRGLSADVVQLPFEPPVERYLRGFDLYVLPSRWESLPIAVLEAMACGLPVLATDVGGTGEAVQDGVTGRLVAPGDAEALAAALAEMTADRDALVAMGEAARARAAGLFALERAVDEVEAVYRELSPASSGRD
jgi:glycosyltransferase involved in cell wall biosynthesis